MEEDFLGLMNDAGEVRNDIRCPEGDIGKEIKDKVERSEDFVVTILKAMGEEMAIACKNLTK